MDCFSPLRFSRLPHEPLGRFRIMLHAATRKFLNKIAPRSQSAALFIKHFYSLEVAQCIYLAALDLKLTRSPTLSFVTAHSHAKEDEMNRDDAYENRPSKSKGDALGRGLESLMGDQESWQAHQAADARPNYTAHERGSQTRHSEPRESDTPASTAPESVRRALEPAQVPYAQNIEETLQNPELPTGCEAASLAAVLYGTQDDSVLLCDPLEGLVTRDAQEFERIWEACGSMTVLIS